MNDISDDEVDMKTAKAREAGVEALEHEGKVADIDEKPFVPSHGLTSAGTYSKKNKTRVIYCQKRKRSLEC